MENSLGKSKLVEKNESEIVLSSEAREVIKSLENFSQLQMRDRMFILLILRGLKTASPVSLLATEPESTVIDLEKKVTKAGLLFKKTDIVTKERRYGLREGRVCYVANNPKDLALISELWFKDHEHDPKVYNEIGRMSGYPKTSIDIFDSFQNPKYSVKKRENAIKGVFTEEDKKAELLDPSKFPEDLYPFSKFFYMSKAHWEEELETVRKWAEEIKRIAPDFYAQFLLKYKQLNTTLF